MIQRTRRISGVVVRRLPAYLRILDAMDTKETPIISSEELGRLAGVRAGQVRKDLTLFGVFGKQGVGYRAATLRIEIRRILRLDHPVPVGLVGAGHLGIAVARYDLERERRHPGGTKLVAIFDRDIDKIGTSLGPLVIKDVRQLEAEIESLGMRILIIAVPASEAQSIVDRGLKSGVKAFLNFAPVSLKTPEDARVNSADVGLELEALSFYA